MIYYYQVVNIYQLPLEPLELILLAEKCAHPAKNTDDKKRESH